VNALPRFGDSVVAGAICGVASSLLTARAHGLGSLSALIVPLSTFLLFGLIVGVARNIGLGTFWIVSGVFWCAQVYFAQPIDGPVRAPGQMFLARGLGIAPSFVSWGIVGIPLYVATWVWLYRRGRLRPRLIYPYGLGVVLLSSFEVARALSSIPWDAASLPVQQQTVAWMFFLVLAPIPFLISAGMSLLALRQRPMQPDSPRGGNNLFDNPVPAERNRSNLC